MWSAGFIAIVVPALDPLETLGEVHVQLSLGRHCKTLFDCCNGNRATSAIRVSYGSEVELYFHVLCCRCGSFLQADEAGMEEDFATAVFFV